MCVSVGGGVIYNFMTFNDGDLQKVIGCLGAGFDLQDH